jgi:hypothetical protein
LAAMIPSLRYSNPFLFINCSCNLSTWSCLKLKVCLSLIPIYSRIILYLFGFFILSLIILSSRKSYNYALLCMLPLEWSFI